jgi:hypothetical protein
MGSHKKDPPGSVFKRNRNGRVHIDNAREGFDDLYPFMQVHHILPVECLAEETINKNLEKDAAQFIRNCLKITDWDINAEPNLVRMPVKAVYWLPDKHVNNWDKYPCHLVDHNPYYNDEVTEDLSKMWKNLHGNAEECEVDETTMQTALEAKSRKWLRFLATRAKRAGGVGHCWKNKDTLADWYHPFSMADPPQPRQPPKSWDELEESLKEYVKGLFERL